MPLGSAKTTAVRHGNLLLFADTSAASAAMTAMIAAKRECGWSETIVDWVPGYDTDVLVTSRFLGSTGPQGYVPSGQATGLQDAFMLHRGAALWIKFTEVPGKVKGGYADGSVDVRQELGTVMGLCYP